MDSKYLLDKIKKTNGNNNNINNNYSNEFNSLKAKDSEYKKNYGTKNSYNNSRHNSGGENLSWRKGSNAEVIKENNNYQKKGNFISDK